MNRAKPLAALRTALAVALLLLFFAGCATLPESEPAPPAELPTLWEAAAAGDIDALDAHRQAGTSLNSLEPEVGVTPLTVAAASYQHEAVHWLLANGADVNARGGDGGSALLTTAFLGQADAARILLDAGADAGVRNDNGMTAWDMIALDWETTSYILDMLEIDLEREALEAGRQEVLALLQPALDAASADDIWLATEPATWRPCASCSPAASTSTSAIRTPASRCSPRRPSSATPNRRAAAGGWRGRQRPQLPERLHGAARRGLRRPSRHGGDAARARRRSRGDGRRRRHGARRRRAGLADHAVRRLDVAACARGRRDDGRQGAGRRTAARSTVGARPKGAFEFASQTRRGAFRERGRFRRTSARRWPRGRRRRPPAPASARRAARSAACWARPRPCVR